MYKAKIDLHCHSSASSNPGLWLLKQIGCSESYTKPESVYKTASNRGMDFITITDHDVIDGAKEISHHENVIISKEVTALFPDKVKVHVICLDITEDQHKDIDKFRHNIYDLVDYLSKEDIINFIAHPLYKVSGNLTWEHFEKLILLFKRHEILNGSRCNRTNLITEKFLSSLTKSDIEKLANKHNIEPIGEKPWDKFFVGGSDDHGGLFIGSCYTEVIVEEMTKKCLMEGIRKGYTTAHGRSYNSLTLAHQISSVANQYLLSKGNDDSQESLILKRILDRNENKNGKKKKKSGFAWLKKISKSINQNSEKKTFNIIDEVRLIVKEKPELSKLFQKRQLEDGEFNELFFTLSVETLDHLLIKAIKKPKLIVNLLIWGSIILSTYLTSMSSMRSDDDLITHAESLLGIKKAKKVAWFTDRYSGIDGVVVTVKKFLNAGIEYGCDLTLAVSEDPTFSQQKGVKVFPPITNFTLPMYNTMNINVPSLLRVARWLEEEEFTSVVISTPGPMGFAGMIAAKVLKLPITAIYHTDYPRYAQQLTDDPILANTVTNLTKAFYSQANKIFVPSSDYAEELKSWNINAEKISILQRWVDREIFSPEKKNGYFGNTKEKKLLFVGRISKEKNIDLLLKAYSELANRDLDFVMYCVGEGPYLGELKQKTKELNKIEFLGPIFGEELAEIYASADIFLFPSLTDSFGNVVLEAQASGLPCVVMHKGGPKEIVINGKSGIVAESEEAFINAIDQLIKNDNLRLEMSRSAVINAQRFDKKEIFNKFWQEI